MKRYIITIIILLITAISFASIQRAHSAAAAKKTPVNVFNIPSSVGDYTQFGDDVDPGEDIKEQLETSAILMRTYRAPTGRHVQLTIVYAGTTRRSLHFPEVCLVGQGWEIGEQSKMPVGFFFDASKLSLVKGERHDAALYWFKTRDNLTGNFFENSWHWACEQLTTGSAASAMIRISTPVLNDGEESAFLLLEDFAVQLTHVLMDYME